MLTQRPEIATFDSTTGQTPEILLWSDEVHEQEEASLLSFWRLSFAPDYQRDQIFESLSKFYDATGITAHIVYETLGEFDLLLRLWIPRKYIPAEIENRLRDCLAGTNLWNVNYIQCTTVSHWARRPAARTGIPQDRAKTDVSNELINSVNAYNDAQVTAFRALDPLLDSPPEIRTPDRPDGVDALVAEGLLLEIPVMTRGVRFYITFDHPRRALSPAELTDVIERIDKKCDEVKRVWAARDPNGVEPQISFYSGIGTMTDFLVLARAPYGHFHAFVKDVVLGLRTISLDKLHQMRPYTHVLADEMFSDFQEHRPTVESTNIEQEIASASESETREFKASFALDVRRVWREGRYEKSTIMTDNVIKAVCGLLNSRDGGVLAIGVLELEREVQKLSDSDRLLVWAREEFKYKAQPDENGVLPNLVMGVKMEYGRGRPYPDSDRYLGAIRDALKDNIQPSPWSWLRQVVRTVSEREVVLISARPADTWCYAKLSKSEQLQFFVREAASTRAYQGLEADLYKNANPRPRRGGKV